MRDRISNGIAKRLKDNPTSEHIEKQATLLHSAQITTIDSFCLYLVKNHFHEIGLDPAFRIADEGERKLLQKEVIDEILEKEFLLKRESFLNCIEYFCPNGKERTLEQYILNLYDFADSNPWPKEWLLERKEDYRVTTLEDFAQTIVADSLLRYLSKMMKGCLQQLLVVQAIVQQPDGPHMYGELIDQEIEQIESLCSCTTLLQWQEKLPKLTFDRLSTKKDETVSPIKRELAKSIRTNVKDICKELAGTYFSMPLETSISLNCNCQSPLNELIDLTIFFMNKFLSEQPESKIIDFSDMEHYALEILINRENGELSPRHVALEYRKYFHDILIDEYLDSNLL